MIIDKQFRQVESRDAAKGIVARADLYMSQKYDVKLSQSQRILFEVLDKQYPPSDWEKRWSDPVAAIEGSANPLIN